MMWGLAARCAAIGRQGAARAPFALGIASLIMGFPIFFDAGLIVMLPQCRRSQGPPEVGPGEGP